MTYDLAKKLKDAGFPMPDFVYNDDGTRDRYDPSLSELIEACGERFSALRRTSRGWQAFDNVYVDDDGFTAREGPTPEEAVANLWLALNT